MKTITKYEIPAESKYLAASILISLGIWHELYPPIPPSETAPWQLVIKTADTPVFSRWVAGIGATPARDGRVY